MTFTRTPSGLSNLYLFYSVDAVVFVEGGASYSYHEVISGSFDPQSDDIAFWQKLFLSFLPNNKYKFRSVGSCHTLDLLADDVIQNRISNVVVAMDRDFKHLKGMLKIGRGILYTYGYSWENDLWQKEVLKRTFFELCPVCQIEINLEPEINACFDSFFSEMRWVVYADFLLNLHNVKFEDFRTKPDSIVSVNAAGKPQVNRSRVRGLIKQSKINKTCALNAGGKIRLSVLSDCNGHVYDVFGFRLLTFLLRTYCENAPSLPKMYAHTTAIGCFLKEMFDGNLPDIYNHYQQQFAQI